MVSNIIIMILVLILYFVTRYEEKKLNNELDIVEKLNDSLKEENNQLIEEIKKLKKELEMSDIENKVQKKTRKKK